MNKHLLLSFYFFQVLNAFGQEWGNVGFVPPANRYEDIFFINSLTGWTLNDQGEIFKTTNGGLEWKSVFKADRYLRSIEFINEKVGFAGALDYLLFRTDDGGTTWTPIQNNIPGYVNGICGLAHFQNNVYGVGEWAYPAYFIKSVDSGLSWSYKDMSDHARGLVDCHFINENVGFVSGTNAKGVILKTSDGGLTWKEVFKSSGFNEYVWKLFFVTDLVAYASIESWDTSTRIAKTTDGGDSWTELLVSPLSLDIQGIGFINEEKGWVSPRYSPVYETLDGGLTWQRSNGMANINRFQKINSSTMYASGSVIYKFYNNIPPLIEPEPIQMHAILEVNPNPFRNDLNIQIRIDRNTYAKLDLFSVDGSFIFNIQDGRINWGKHYFPFSAHELNLTKSGTYVLFLRTDEGFLSKKIIRIE